MTDLTVKKLSDYAEGDLVILQLALSIAYQTTKQQVPGSPSLDIMDQWAYRIRQAIEDKRDEYADYSFI